MNRDVRIEETEKTVEIRDSRDNLKYTVQLSRYQTPISHGSEIETVYAYWVSVQNENGELIYDSEEFLRRKDAERDFDRNVSNYSLLVKAQSKPVDSIQVYAEKIGYKKIDPDCCLNCEFCKIERKYRQDGTLVCVNPKNFTIFENLDIPEECDCRRRNRDEWIGFDPSWIPSEIGNVGYSFGDRKPPYRKGSYAYMDVKPKVDFNGICENYIRRGIKPRPPHPPRPTA